MSDSVHDILIGLGYSLKDFGKHYRAKPLYRDSNNSTSLSINKETGWWLDFSLNKMGDINDLISITLGLKNKKEAEDWLTKNNFSNIVEQFYKPKITSPKVFDIKNITLLPEYSYWNNRGVSTETLRLFESGLCKEGKQKDRFVFPIFNQKHQLIGTAGRSIFPNPEIKWKLLGQKSNWFFPFYLNIDILKQKKEIILIESVGDCLSLWEAGIKNSMVLFGILLGGKRLSTLIKLNPSKIIIALNKDGVANNMVGETNAKTIYEILCRHFDADKIQISLPTKNDFGEMNTTEILNWYAKT